MRNKVPVVTATVWIIKILPATIGGEDRSSPLQRS
jgi:uncharacterized membrane-anchored protein